jgi:hypothetical protein
MRKVHVSFGCMHVDVAAPDMPARLV